VPDTVSVKNGDGGSLGPVDREKERNNMDGMILIVAPFLPTIVLLALVFMVLRKRKKKEMATKK
jgi:hypothetical protein